MKRVPIKTKGFDANQRRGSSVGSAKRAGERSCEVEQQWTLLKTRIGQARIVPPAPIAAVVSFWDTAKRRVRNPYPRVGVMDSGLADCVRAPE